MKILDNVEMEAESRAHVLAPPSQSEKGRGTGIEFAIAPHDAGVDRDSQIELGHTSKKTAQGQ